MDKSLLKLLALSVLALGFVLLLSGCAEPDLTELPLPETPEEVLAELTDARSKIDHRTEQILERIRAWNDTRTGNERKVYFAEIFEEPLTAKEQGVLNKLFEEEQNVSYRGLLSQIIVDRDRIQDYQDRIASLEERLPRDTVTVARGDTHYRIAIRYLAEKHGMSEEVAAEKIRQINLDDDILPGYKVWLFYQPETDIFASWVHRGDAKHDPLAVQWAKRRRMISERDEAVAKVAGLEDRKLKLEGEILGLETSVLDLEARRANLEKQISQVTSERDTQQEIAQVRESEIERINNSLFYYASTEADLKDKRVEGWFNRLKDIKGVEYNEYLDLRASTAITFAPGDFGLKKIDKVAMLPKHFKPGVDYTVQIASNGDATIEILQPQMFRGQKVLFSIKD